MAFLWISLALFGLGLFICTSRCLPGDLRRLPGSSAPPALESSAAASERKDNKVVQVTPDDLTGLGKIPWMLVYLLALAAGLGLYVFTQQMFVLFLAFVPLSCAPG